MTKHWSDCAVHSEPAYPAGECDCGGFKQYQDEGMCQACEFGQCTAKAGCVAISNPPLKQEHDKQENYQGSDAAKAAHMMDLYTALGVRWGDDPFAVIAKMRSIAEAEKQERPTGPATSADRYFYEAGFEAGRQQGMKQEQGEPAASDAYDKIDRFLRNNLGDVDYAEYSAALDSVYTTPQQRKPLWIDTNDKTQAKFLPNIGEPVVFCCRGETYIGIHTGGGFQDALNNENYFNTWSCKWMPIPLIEAAHGAKDEA